MVEPRPFVKLQVTLRSADQLAHTSRHGRVPKKETINSFPLDLPPRRIPTSILVSPRIPDPSRGQSG